MKLQMLNDHAYVTVESNENTTDSGLIISNDKNQVSYGTIYAVDEDNMHGLEVGDKIAFNAPMDLDVTLPDGTEVKDIILDVISSIIR